MLRTKPMEDKLVKGYIREFEQTHASIKVPDVLIGEIFRHYANKHFWEWKGRESILDFVQSENDDCYVDKEFEIWGIDKGHIKLHFELYPNHNGKVGLKINVQLQKKFIYYMTFNLILYSYELQRSYINTFETHQKEGDFGADNLINTDQIRNLKYFSFAAKLTVLNICDNYGESIYSQTNIKLNKKTNVNWDISKLSIKRFNNEVIYSPFYGHSDNFIFFIEFKTNALYVRVLQMPHGVHEIDVSISSNLYGQCEKKQITNCRLSYSSNTSCIGIVMGLNDSSRIIRAEIHTIRAWTKLNDAVYENENIIDNA